MDNPGNQYVRSIFKDRRWFMKNDLKWVLIYIAIITYSVFMVFVCFEIYYRKEEIAILRQHNELALELRVKRIEEILE